MTGEELKALVDAEWKRFPRPAVDPKRGPFWSPRTTPPFPDAWPHDGRLDFYAFADGFQPCLMDGVRIAAETGARIATGTRVTRLRQDAGGWRAETALGHELRARSVVLATNAYSGDLVPWLRESLVTLHSFQIATSVLPAELDRRRAPREEHRVPRRPTLKVRGRTRDRACGSRPRRRH